ncbi:Zinc metalloproteinase nas-14 [Trichinella spiralis]|uniref:Zinc metalloproteinase nas-14 n=1 Tax=Trichinella spiralis TaxID=6334 RepID=A0ABR3K5T6_TRISP
MSLWSTFMGLYALGSVFICITVDDNDFKCSFWAHLGECERIPGFMVTMCPVSCGICCV